MVTTYATAEPMAIARRTEVASGMSPSEVLLGGLVRWCRPVWAERWRLRDTQHVIRFGFPWAHGFLPTLGRSEEMVGCPLRLTYVGSAASMSIPGHARVMG